MRQFKEDEVRTFFPATTVSRAWNQKSTASSLSSVVRLMSDKGHTGRRLGMAHWVGSNRQAQDDLFSQLGMRKCRISNVILKKWLLLVITSVHSGYIRVPAVMTTGRKTLTNYHKWWNTHTVSIGGTLVTPPLLQQVTPPHPSVWLVACLLVNLLQTWRCSRPVLWVMEKLSDELFWCLFFTNQSFISQLWFRKNGCRFSLH